MHFFLDVEQQIMVQCYPIIPAPYESLPLLKGEKCIWHRALATR
jgi:hypothetical protein